MKPSVEKEYRGRVYCDRFPGPPRFSPQQEYPEADITTTATPDRRASYHSNNIPEARREMITGLLIPALATARPKRDIPER